VLRLTLRGLTARKLRGVLTTLAVFFGVAMIAGTLMLTDTVNSSFDSIFVDAKQGVDVSVKTTETIEDSRDGQPPAFEAAMLEEVEAVPGVAEAAGSIFDPTLAILDDAGERIGPQGPPHFAVSVVPDRFSPWTYTEGSAPTAADEIGIDSITAEEEGYELGDTIRIAGTEPATEYTVSGIAEFGSGVSLLGASLAIMTPEEAQRLTGKQDEFDEIVIAAEEGVSPEELKGAVDEALPASLTVRTGEEVSAAESGDFKEGFSFLSSVLLVFGGIALFVGGFLIFNTFSITVAQRTREFGMLRTLGASARQVLGTVALEAVIIGLVASLLGIAGGIGFVVFLRAFFDALGFSLPSAGLVLSASTVFIALVVGLLSTTVASIIPALRATRVSPIEALREGPAPRRPRRRRTLTASLVAAVGAVAIVWGLFATDSLGEAATFIGLGMILLFIGVAMLGRRLIPPLAALVGRPIERLRGVTGLLARENTLRNPGRTSTTAAAVMIGIALVIFVAVFASAISKSFDEVVDRDFAGDLVLQNTDGFSRIPGAVAESVAEVPGVAVASAVAGGDGEVEGISGTQRVSGLDPETVSQVFNIDWVDGSDATLAELGGDGAIIESDWGADNGVEVGDTIQVSTPTGREAAYTVLGSARDAAGLLIQTFAIPRDTLAQDFGIRADDFATVGFSEGEPFDVVRARVDAELVETSPNVEARSQQELKDDQREELNSILALIYVLLALSVLISLFGVVNTLVLTIHERTREIGMLRAIGMSRNQVRRMVRYESVITAMIGAIMGAAIGLALAVIAVIALEDEGLVLSIPYPLLVIVLVLAAVAGAAAAIAPARRAAKINVIEALQYE
jgi:putative ABC transport system permease protein